MISKHILTSRTLWANTVGAVLAFLAIFGLDLALTPEEKSALVTVIMAVINVILRLDTKQPVHILNDKEAL